MRKTDKIILTDEQKNALRTVNSKTVADYFAEKLLEFCDTHNVTLHHIAELMECDPMTLYHWTSVRKHIPTLGHIVRVSIVTGMSVQELLGC